MRQHPSNDTLMSPTETVKSEKKSKVKSRHLEFHTMAGEAQFWDTHSPLDFSGEFREVDVTIVRPLQHVLAVRF